MAEASAMAIKDAGLRKEDIDGIMTFGGLSYPGPAAEYIGINARHFAAGTSMMGASNAVALTVAASVIQAGLAKNILCTFGGGRDTTYVPRGFVPSQAPSERSEWQVPYGMAVAANTGYGFLYSRHMWKFGTKPEQFAQMSVNQRFNAQKNPNAAFAGQEITVQDVLNSRYINEPLHILECVMPVAGATAYIVTSAEHAKSMPNRRVLLLGAGVCQGSATHWLSEDMTTLPTKVSAASALEMAGYRAKDIEFAEFYDCYTILEAVCLEDAGFCPKGEIGNFFQSTDTTYKGTFPINTDGGQLSAGQLNPAGASGSQNTVEAIRQLMGKAGERQVKRNNLCMVNA
jgi:acetyl-CoA acetyltransferase